MHYAVLSAYRGPHVILSSNGFLPIMDCVGSPSMLNTVFIPSGCTCTMRRFQSLRGGRFRIPGSRWYEPPWRTCFDRTTGPHLELELIPLVFNAVHDACARGHRPLHVRHPLVLEELVVVHIFRGDAFPYAGVIGSATCQCPGLHRT